MTVPGVPRPLPAPDADDTVSSTHTDDRPDPLEASGLTRLPVGAELGDVATCLRRLAGQVNGAGPLDRRVLRNRVIAALKKVKVQDATGLVDAALPKGDADSPAGQGHTVTLSDPEPWPAAVDGASVLADLADTYRRFVALPDGAATALALWTVHAHAHDAVYCSPLLTLTSPERRCGKSTTLKVVGALAPRPLPAASISPAALFRGVEKYRPTLLLDEADTAFRVNEELRALVNGAHDRAGAVTLRTVGDEHEPRTFSTWCPKAIALIGKLPPTLTDRAIVLPLRRRRRDERVERLRLDRLGELEPLRRQAWRWTRDHVDALRAADSDVPAELHDRAADNWRPLLAIADLAGGDWPARARHAARALSGSDDADDDAPAVLLLGDLRELFGERATDRLATEAILQHLTALETRPWPEWGRGRRPLTARQLARLLERFGVRPRTVRDGLERFKGYLLRDFGDAFSRYLPSDPCQGDTPAVTGVIAGSASVTGTAPVTDGEDGNPSKNRGCHGVTDGEGGPGLEADVPPPGDPEGPAPGRSCRDCGRPAAGADGRCYWCRAAGDYEAAERAAIPGDSA